MYIALTFYFVYEETEAQGVTSEWFAQSRSTSEW